MSEARKMKLIRVIIDNKINWKGHIGYNAGKVTWYWNDDKGLKIFKKGVNTQ